MRVSQATLVNAELVWRRRQREGRRVIAPRRVPPPIDIPLWPKQQIVRDSHATEILFGGAAGPGKSHLLRALAVLAATNLPGCQIYLFRRTSEELWSNHLEGSNSLLEMLAPWIATGDARFNQGRLRIAVGPIPKRAEDPQPALIRLCHLQAEKDLKKYQGAGIHLLLPDELTHLTSDEYRYLRARVRLLGYQPPAEAAERFERRFGMTWKEFLPRIVSGTNPGSIGHNWVKAAFVNSGPYEIRQMPTVEGGMKRQFIPALLADNLVDQDGYADRLAGLGRPELVKAMLEGSWDIVEGGALDDVWNRDVHWIPPFAIPSTWSISCSLDWGSSKPYSVGYWAESDGTEAELADGRRRSWPAGTLFRVGEIYGCARSDGGEFRPNVGLKQGVTEVAAEMLAYQTGAPWGWRVIPGPADSAIFDAGDDPAAVTIAAQFAAAGIHWERSWKDPGSRKFGLDSLRARFSAGRTWPMEAPGIFIFTNCPAFSATVPNLPRHKTKQDDVDTNAEDHVYDETRYRLSWVRSAPDSAEEWNFGMPMVGGASGWR